MLTYSIIIAAIESFIALLCGVLVVAYDPFSMAALILIMVPLLPLSIAGLIRSIRSFKTSSLKSRSIASTIISGATLMNFFLLIILMVFVFSQGGRLPHEVFY